MDQFKDWDRFNQHFTLTQDPHKALRWLRYDKWAEKRRLKHLEQNANLLACASAGRAHKAASTKNT